jgi:hypothetical protein
MKVVGPILSATEVDVTGGLSVFNSDRSAGVTIVFTGADVSIFSGSADSLSLSLLSGSQVKVSSNEDVLIGVADSDTFIDIQAGPHVVRLQNGGGQIYLGDPRNNGAGNLLTLDGTNASLTHQGGRVAFSTDSPDFSGDFPAAITPAPSSLLDLQSTVVGFLTPRMTEEERDVISSPAEGLIIYNLTTHKLNIFNGTEWKAVAFE